MIFSRNVKRMLVTLLSLVLVAAVISGTALAYLSYNAGEETNVFTFGQDIRAKLTEPNWDQTEGNKLVPGKQVDKDPMITNTCKIYEYVAVKLTFQYNDKSTTMSAADYSKLASLVDFDWNIGTEENKWTVFSGANTNTVVLIYNKAIAPGEVTTPVMNSATVITKADGLTEANLRWLQGVKVVNGEYVEDTNALGGFNIKIEGAAIQSDAYSTPALAASTLNGLFT